MAAVVLFASCAKEENSAVRSNETLGVKVSFNLDQAAGTRVSMPVIPDNCLLRYVVEVYDATGTTKYSRVAFVKDSGDAVLDGSAQPFEIRVPRMDGTYKVIAWADYVADGTTNATANTADKWYNTQSGLKAIGAVTTGYVANDPEREAFFSNDKSITVADGAITGAGSAAGTPLAIVCKRAVARLSFFTTEEMSVIPSSQRPLSSKVNNTGETTLELYTAFNAFSGAASAATALTAMKMDIPFVSSNYVSYDKTPPTGITNSALMYQDLVLASSTSSNTLLVDMDLNLYNAAATAQAGGNNISVYTDITSIPLQANYRTNVFGSFMTLTGYITIAVDADWDGDKNVDPSGNTL